MIHKSIPTFLISVAVAGALAACAPESEVIVEPTAFGDYHMINRASVTIDLSASELFTNAPVALFADRVEPGQDALIYTFIEGSGGHVFPSNAFAEFSASAPVDGRPTVIYSAVDDDRWELDGSTEDGHLILEFSISDEDIEAAEQQ